MQRTLPFRFVATLALLLIASFRSTGQPWRAIVKLGCFWNSASTQPATNEHGWPFSGMGSAGLSKDIGQWEIGATAGLYRYAYHMEGNFTIKNSAGAPFNYYADFIRDNPGFALMPFVNRHLDTGRLSWYAGIAPAYIRIFNHDLEDVNRQININTNGNCFGLMLQGGCTYRVSKEIMLFAEPFAEVINIPGFAGRAYMYVAGLALGCHVAIRPIGD